MLVIVEQGGQVAMERKPRVFALYRGQLEFLNCISRVSEGSGLSALHRLGHFLRPTRRVFGQSRQIHSA